MCHQHNGHSRDFIKQLPPMKVYKNISHESSQTLLIHVIMKTENDRLSSRFHQLDKDTLGK